MSTKYEGHTPGPWEVAPTLALEIISRTHGIIAKPCSGNMVSAPFNARLMADAPTLLAQRDALAAALATMLGAADTDCLDDKSNVWRSAMLDARAALAALTD